MTGNRLIVGALVAAVATVAGCTLTITYDPRGIDVSLEGEWFVNGVPANSSNCLAAGIDSVQLVFYDGGVAYEYSEFFFPCAQGFFDTRPLGALDHGRYQTQWVAYDASQTEIGRGDMIVLDVTAFSIDHAILAAPDFIITGLPVVNEMTVDFAWGLGSETCIEAGAASIFWALNDAGGNEVISDTGTCDSIADRLIFSDLLPDTYSLFADAESSDRMIKWQGTCDMLLHDGLETSYSCIYDLMP